MQPRAMRAGWLGDVRVARDGGPPLGSRRALVGLSEVPQWEGGARAERGGEGRGVSRRLGRCLESPIRSRLALAAISKNKHHFR